MSFEYLNSTFGASEMTWGPYGQIPGGARTFLGAPRFMELDRKQSYYDCTQHDFKEYDFDGRMVQPFKSLWSQPLLTQDAVPWFIPLRSRRPSHPYRLSRVIVGSFTNLVFGSQRFPALKSQDANTQDCAQAISEFTNLPSLAIRARNIGGSVGTVGWSWSWDRGKPRIELHNGKNLFVHSWEDRDLLIPRHVSKILVRPRDEWDREKNRYVRNWYWFRQDWLPDADIVFHECLMKAGEEPHWMPDPLRSHIHKENRTHFVWTQNLPTEDIDGEADCDGIYDNCDSIDLLLSVALRGSTLNLDPTLVLAMDLDQVARMGVRKGSDNALVVGQGGSASYLEMSGSGNAAALELFKNARANALEVSQCVVVDPDKLAAAGISSVAMKAIFSTMTGKTDILRDQYGPSIKRVLNDMIESARGLHKKRVIYFHEDNSPYEVEQFIDLPPRIEETTVTDDDGNEVDTIQTEVEREPGLGQITTAWGQYFAPTPDDRQKDVATGMAANGGKPVLSQKSASEYVAQSFGLDPTEEWNRIQEEQKVQDQKQASMFGDPGFVGGQVSERDELPPGVDPIDDTARAKLEELTDEETLGEHAANDLLSE